jgi:hypothetical protein
MNDIRLEGAEQKDQPAIGIDIGNGPGASPHVIAVIWKACGFKADAQPLCGTHGPHTETNQPLYERNACIDIRGAHYQGKWFNNG